MKVRLYSLPKALKFNKRSRTRSFPKQMNMNIKSSSVSVHEHIYSLTNSSFGSFAALETTKKVVKTKKITIPHSLLELYVLHRYDNKDPQCQNPPHRTGTSIQASAHHRPFLQLREVLLQ
ncbi:hypothetical protein Hanom_Chr13g01223501 [Helianthus anomalus]